MHQSILIYRGFRYLKLSSLLVLLAIVAYVAHTPRDTPNGGTWLGYTLGTIGAVLILWLMWFGIRKRRYGPGNVLLEDWLSAHVYLGLGLIFIATLHTGFQFGLNVHTLAYVLMMLVILSGIFGVFAYIRYPREMTGNRRGATLDGLLQEIAERDRDAREAAIPLGDEVNEAVLRAARNTRIGGGVLRQLSGRDRSCPTVRALALVNRQLKGARGREAEGLSRLASILERKSDLLRRARQDVRFQALMQVWLFIHVPFTFALLAALIAHVLSVFLYW